MNITFFGKNSLITLKEDTLTFSKLSNVLFLDAEKLPHLWNKRSERSDIYVIKTSLNFAM